MSSFLSSFFLVCVLLSCKLKGESTSRPHVFFIMGDQHRGDAIGAINTGAITPNLDSIFADGVLFRNAYSSTPTCTPARAAILTGRSPWYHGMLGYGSVATKYPYEMVHAINANNYYSAAIGKNHFGWWNNTLAVSHGYYYMKIYDGLHSGMPGSAAYDDYDKWFQSILPGQDPLATGNGTMDWNSWRGDNYCYSEYLHPTAWVTNESLTFLNDYFINNKYKSSNNESLFMKISFHRPHSPYDPPIEYLNSIKTKNMKLPIAGVTWDYIYKNDSTHCGPQNQDAWCGDMLINNSYSVRDKGRRAYYGNIKFVDKGIGDIINKLKELNIYNDSFIFYTSDHGDGQGDHYLWRKGYPYEITSNIPFLLKWPSYMDNNKNIIPRGSFINSVIELRDILPTVLNMTNTIKPNDVTLDGNNLICLLYNNNNCNWREYIDLEHNIVYNKTNHWNALVSNKWKYIFNAYYASEQLFDLENDRLEYYNLAPLANIRNDINNTLVLWRQRLVELFEQQERGDTWVLNGTLQQRQNGQLYSPYYPDNAAPVQDTQDTPDFVIDSDYY